jgi:hypothetical protein
VRAGGFSSWHWAQIQTDGVMPCDQVVTEKRSSPKQDRSDNPQNDSEVDAMHRHSAPAGARHKIEIHLFAFALKISHPHSKQHENIPRRKFDLRQRKMMDLGPAFFVSSIGPWLHGRKAMADVKDAV